MPVHCYAHCKKLKFYLPFYNDSYLKNSIYSELVDEKPSCFLISSNGSKIKAPRDLTAKILMKLLRDSCPPMLRQG